MWKMDLLSKVVNSKGQKLQGQQDRFFSLVPNDEFIREDSAALLAGSGEGRKVF